MKLKQFIIINYRSCKFVKIDIDDSSPSIIIGVNDTGKTTVLKALELFFENKNNANFINDKSIKNDLSNTVITPPELQSLLSEAGLPAFKFYSSEQIILIAKFEFEATEEATELSAQLNWAAENSKTIFVSKVFDKSCIGGKYYLLNADYDGLVCWEKNEKGLIEIMDTRSIIFTPEDNTNKVGKATNVERIKKIYSHYENQLVLDWYDYNYKTDRGNYPIFRLLTWDSNLDDLKNVVADSMGESIKEIQSQIFQQAKDSSKQATDIVNQQLVEITREFIDELPSINRIETNINFSIQTQSTDILVGKDHCDGLIHIESQGDGIKRQIWFVLLKWLSNKKISASKVKKVFWCFDEPETHLYPSAQREFISSISKLCCGSYQSVIATHSTVFVDKAKLKDVYKINLEDKYSKISNCQSVRDVYSALQIKNSDFLFYDKFLAVEGPTEYELIPFFYNLIYSRTLFEDNIQIINLKGETNWKNNKYILGNLLKDFNDPEKTIHYLLDSDTNCLESNVSLVGKADFEDSLPNSLWSKILKNHFSNDLLTEADLDEIRNKIDVNISQKDKKFHSLLVEKIKAIFPGPPYLPNKGDAFAELVKKHILVDEIPDVIKNVFLNVRNNAV